MASAHIVLLTPPPLIAPHFPHLQVSFQGTQKYINNLEIIGGKSALGSFLFDSSSSKIILHSLLGGVPTPTGYSPLRTRWTLTAFFKPTGRRILFTGVSDYTLTSSGLIKEQRDYWDSINDPSLNNTMGGYTSKPAWVGLADFAKQCISDSATIGADELPYVTVFRGPDYEVRKYAGGKWCGVEYEGREGGYMQLGSIFEGLEALRPCRCAVREGGEKVMSWPGEV